MRGVAAILILVILNACGSGPPRTQIDSQKPYRIPSGLQFQREISGRLLAYNLKRPSGLALSSTGDLFIADTGNHRLIKLDRDLQPVGDYGGFGTDVGRFQNPEDLFIDRGLNLYVLDTGNRRVVQLDAGLHYIDDFVAADDPEEIISTLGKLSGLTVSTLGEITLADYDNSRLIRLDNFRRFSRYVGDFGYGAGSLLNPLDLAQGRNGRIYAADAGNGRIAVYDDYGNFLFQIGQNDLKRPSAVAISGNGTIWVADQELDVLFAFGPNGERLLREGSHGYSEFRWSDIEALIISEDGRLFVADSGNNRVLIYQVIYEENR